MPWTLVYVPEFVEWLENQQPELRKDIIRLLEILSQAGPILGRPKADTIKGSKFSNLKELRLNHRGMPIRILFIFDAERNGVVLLGGNKLNDKRWYERNVPIAENRFENYLRLKNEEEK